MEILYIYMEILSLTVQKFICAWASFRLSASSEAYWLVQV